MPTCHMLYAFTICTRHEIHTVRLELHGRACSWARVTLGENVAARAAAMPHSKAEVYKQIVATARARDGQQAEAESQATGSAAAGSRIAALEATLAGRVQELETAKRKAMAYVQELLLDKQALTRSLEEDEVARVQAAEALRQATDDECHELAEAARQEAVVQRAAEEEATEARARAQELRETTESLKRGGSSGAPHGGELEAARRGAARQAERLRVAQDVLRTAEAATDEAGAAADSALAGVQAASSEVGAARDAAARSAAVVAGREEEMARAERALASLSPEARQLLRSEAGAKAAAASASAAAGSGEGDMRDISLTPHARGARRDGTSQPPTPVPMRPVAQEADERPLAEVLAEWTIDGAKADSAIINPVLGYEAILDYVNDWRDAFAQPAPPAPPAPPAATVVVDDRP